MTVDIYYPREGRVDEAHPNEFAELWPKPITADCLRGRAKDAGVTLRKLRSRVRGGSKIGPAGVRVYAPRFEVWQISSLEGCVLEELAGTDSEELLKAIDLEICRYEAWV